ncbi:MAG: hypothetical protein IJM81_05770 [Prevotella sp.]|nr:hypothetical protein [Prevotella sp.]
MLELKEGSLSIDGRTVFRDLSFVVRPGEMKTVAADYHHAVVEAVLGFRALDEGWATLEGELMTSRSARLLRSQMVYIPAELPTWDGSGQAPLVSALLRAPFELDSCEDSFRRRDLMAEWEKLGIDAVWYDRRADEADGLTLRRIMLSVAGVLRRPVVVAEILHDGSQASIDVECRYLRGLADSGRAVLLVTNEK